MNKAREYYPESPEALLVNLARSGDRAAFEELVRRRQAVIRARIWRWSGDAVLADELARRVFLKAWLGIRALRQARAFPDWLQQIALNTWREYAHKHDAPDQADEQEEPLPEADEPGVQNEDEAFIRSVMQSTRRLTWRVLGGALLGLGLLLGILLVLSVPVGDAVLWVVRVVATPLVDIPAGWLSWVLAPVNTLGTLLAALWRLLRMLSRKAVDAAYVD